jgi:hypothetical protein
MKTLLLATLAMCLALSVVAVAQDSPSQAPQKDQAGSTAQLTTLSGTIKAEGDKLTFVNDKSVDGRQSGDTQGSRRAPCTSEGPRKR